MIDHYSLLLDFAHQRQQEMFRQAEIEHLYKQLKENRPTLFRQVSHYLLDAVWQLKAHIQSNPATYILRTK